MKCYRHPREDALFECAVCGKAICGECMRFSEEGDQITCPGCNLGTAAALGNTAAEDLDSYHDSLADAAGRKTGWGLLRIELNSILVLVIAVLFLAYTVLKHESGKIQEPVAFSDYRMMENDSPAPQFTYLLSQVLRYRDEKGTWPSAAADLFPQYIDSQPYILKTKEGFTFAEDPKHGFVLSAPQADRFGFVKMYSTSDGITKIE